MSTTPVQSHSAPMGHVTGASQQRVTPTLPVEESSIAQAIPSSSLPLALSPRSQQLLRQLQEEIPPASTGSVEDLIALRIVNSFPVG